MPADLEDRLYRAADKLRGHVDAAAYKHVVLALLFLRFVAGGGTSLRVPPGLRLAPGDLDAALDALERANPALRGALPRGMDAVPRVGELLDLLQGVRFEGGRDALGEAYEVLLGRFARAEGRRGGQFYTPRCVVALLAALTGPVAGRRVYDPCCGSGGMFVHGAAGAAEVFGQESNPGTWRLARQNLALRGIDADLGAGPADSFLDDRHPGRLADVVLANPPFHQSDWGADRLRDDPRWRYGTPPAGNGNFAWVQHILAHLAPDGTAAVVLSNSSLSATKAGEGAIRRGLVEDGWVDAVVALPPQLFHATPIPACVWLLCRARPDTTLFVDARSLGRRADRAHRTLPPEAIDRVAATVRAYRAGAAESEPGFAAVRTRRELAAQRWALTPARHVGRAPGAERAPARERIRALAAEWRALKDEADRLAADIEEAGLGL